MGATTRCCLSQNTLILIRMDITVMILTFNEEPNIRRTLEKLSWAGEVVVIDSGSTDGTLDILREHANVRIFTRAFDTFAKQCNYGLEQVRTEWVLSLDADYVLTPAFVEELHQLEPVEELAGWKARFVYCVHGRRLRSSLYPPRSVLYRRKLACYEDDGHGHRVSLKGNVQMLKSSILHDDRKPLSRWFSAQIAYAEREALKLGAASPHELNQADRLRRMIWCAPLLVLVYTLFLKGLILDGWPGCFYVFQRMLAETLLSLRLLEQKWMPSKVEIK